MLKQLNLFVTIPAIIVTNKKKKKLNEYKDFKIKILWWNEERGKNIYISSFLATHPSFFFFFWVMKSRKQNIIMNVH